jgi:hypothetical protein
MAGTTILLCLGNGRLGATLRDDCFEVECMECAVVISGATRTWISHYKMSEPELHEPELHQKASDP